MGNSLTESQFNEKVDAVLLAIESYLDESESDLDYETTNGILTITDDDTKIIINRQGAANQLWVAAKSGGFHFDYHDEQGWVRDTDGEVLHRLLNRLFQEQFGEEVSLDAFL